MKWEPVSIIVSVFALALSVFTWWSGQKEAERTRKREYLEDFLRPLQSVLNINREVHQSLTADTRLSQLEFAPDYVQQELHIGLSEDDPRRVIWRAEIGRLMTENAKAVGLVERNIGKVSETVLRVKLEEFKKHALDWQGMWEAILEPNPDLASGYIGAGRLATDPFPNDLDELLAAEISRVEALVGK